MQNVEYKAELRDPALARVICAQIGASLAARLAQTDTYYKLADGRLKKRSAADLPTAGAGPAGAVGVALPDEYIFYARENVAKPRLSQFKIYTPSEALERFGRVDPGPAWIVVKKTREVWMFEHVRIHLDEVEGLGNFLEFEAMVSRQNGIEKCHEMVAKLRADLLPALGEPISTSYSDLLANA
ncbi:MAG: class IV adenylate cyclase [Phycisphaerales bacterium]